MSGAAWLGEGRCGCTTWVAVTWLVLGVGCAGLGRHGGAVWTRHLATPPGVTPEALEPLRGANLRHAATPLARVLEDITWPTELADPGAAVEPQAVAADAVEPDLAVQRRYVRARQAQMERQHADAVRHLQAALREMPDSPRLLRALGQLNFDLGRRTQGVELLQRALRGGDADAYSLVLLGMHALQFNDDEAAIAYLDTARRHAANADPALEVVARYHLGVALLRRGHLAAGLQQLEWFLRSDINAQRTTRYAREAYLLAQQQFATLVQLGDASHRLGRPGQALAFYQEAERIAQGRRAAVLPRLVYTLLRLGRDEEARPIVLDQIRPPAAATELALLDYLIDNDPNQARLSETLAALYELQDRPTSLALRVARLQDDTAAVAFLGGHLEGRPDDRAAFAAMVARTGAAGRLDLATTTWHAALAAVTRMPAAVEAYGDVMAEEPGSARLLARAWERLPAAMQQESAGLYLQGRALAGAGRMDQALGHYQQALTTGGNFAPPRLAAARLLLEGGELDEAERVLAPLAEDVRAQWLRARVLRQRGDAAEALTVMEALLAREPAEPAWALETARLQRELGQPLRAAATLEQALARHPTMAVLYEALFELYAAADAPADAGRRMAGLMQLARTHIPDARITRYRSALELTARQQWAAAEAMVRDLLLEDADDAEAMELLLHLLVAQHRRDEAEHLVAHRLREGRTDAATQEAALRLAGLHAAEGAWPVVDEWLRRLEATERLTSPDLYLSLRGRVLIQHGQADRLHPLVAKLRRQYPDHEADLVYQWAMLLSRMERVVEAERVMAEALARFPDHANLGNALGYTWAEAGRNLSQARDLIVGALRRDPGNAAYLDSMGWVLYKQGAFAEAAGYLQAAVARPGGDHPLLIDHWADALYRLGDHDRALALWEVARQRLGELEGDDPDTRGLPRQLEAKIQALAEGRDVPVAPLGEGVTATGAAASP